MASTHDPQGWPCLPPGQQLAAPGKWPIVGERSPKSSAEAWTLTLADAAGNQRAWSLEELRALPRTRQTIDIHCVTRWSQLGIDFTGVRLAELIAKSGIAADAPFVSFVARSERGHSTSLPLADALALGTLVVWEADGRPLSLEHGGPLRSIVPRRYFYKSVKWLERIELLQQDRLGFWEATAGYHNTADPLREERYMAPTIDRRAAAALLAARDFAGRDLRSLDARGHGLAGLNATGALLRDADFRGCTLTGARFDGANLSNARLAGADLCGATFVGADLEGADFSAADLRGADFSAASLFGATFATLDAEGHPVLGTQARWDATTRFDADRLADLMPGQRALFDTLKELDTQGLG